MGRPQEPILWRSDCWVTCGILLRPICRVFTRRLQAQMRVNYGGWLGWLAARGHLVPDEKPQARATPERIGAYIADLTTVMAPRSVERRITFLVQALRVMVPGLDLAGLRRRAATLNATAVPVRDKRARLVPIPVLIDAG